MQFKWLTLAPWLLIILSNDPQCDEEEEDYDEGILHWLFIFELTSNWAHFSLDYQENDLCEENSLACSRSTSLLKSGLMAYCSRTQVIYLSYLASNIVFGVPGFKYQILIFTSCANKVPHATLLSSWWKSIHLCDFCDERTSTYGIIFVINSSQRSLMLPISLFSPLLLSTMLKQSIFSIIW